ncbi:MAG: 30S ribosomal protein S8 [Victivallales bacterium]|nr:30S ribosomal protein S8 [Victivallales bacterium]
MSMQDPISDMLTGLRNAGMAGLKQITMPSSKVKVAMAEVFKKEGYINDYAVEGEGAKTALKITMKFFNNKPVIEGLKRVSKPSCRIYCTSREIPRIRNGYGTVVMSTPHGIISGQEATKNNVGGEVLCYIW